MFLVLFLIIAYNNDPLLFKSIDDQIKNTGTDLIKSYWCNIKLRYLLLNSSNKFKISHKNSRSYVTSTKPKFGQETVLFQMGHTAWQGAKYKVGQGLTAAGGKLIASSSPHLAQAGSKITAVGKASVSGAKSVPGAVETVKVGIDGISASGAAVTILLGGAFFL